MSNTKNHPSQLVPEDVPFAIEGALRRARALAPANPAKARSEALKATRLARNAQRQGGSDEGLLMLLRGQSYARRADLSWRHATVRRAQRESRCARALYRHAAVAPHVTDHEALLDLTDAMIELLGGRVREAIALVRRAADFFRDVAHDTVAYVNALTTIAAFHIWIDEFIPAKPILGEANRLGRNLLDDENFGAILQNMAICAGMTDDPDFEGCYADACEHFERIGAVEHLRAARVLRADVHRRRGRIEEAIAEYHRIRGEYAKKGDHALAAKVAINIVDIFVEQGRYAEAMLIGRPTLEALTKSGWEHDAATVRELLEKCGGKG